MKALKITGIVLLILAIISASLLLTVFFITKDSQLDIDSLEAKQSRLQITDGNGARLPYKNSNYTPLSEIGEPILTTFVAVEDKRFYKHHGIDISRMITAGFKNLFTLSFKEGASTITQQLIKNTHLSQEKTIKRKLNEIKLALELEKRYSKEQILEMYLNVIYFGSGIYGIHDACMAFFDKKPDEINLAEAAIIVGVVKNPAKNSPLINLDGAKARQKIIFDLLEKQGNLSKSIINNARNYKLIIKNGLKESTFNNSYIKNTIYQASRILNIPEQNLINQNYSIRTYMNRDLQLKMSEMINRDKELDKVYYSYIVTNNENAGIIASTSNLPMTDYNMRRQAGSVLKPFSVYLPAMIQGEINPLTQIIDEPIDIGGYSPHNFNDIYHGRVSVTDSLIQSYNIPAVKLLNQTGIDNSIDFLQNLGIDINEEDKNLSLALGTNSVSALDIASVYRSLAAGGMHKDVGYIDEIRDGNGQVLYKNANIQEKQGFDKDNAFIMTNILCKTSRQGTAKKLKGFNFDIASKTGTAATGGHNTDGWCASYTPDHTVTVWHGARDNNSLDNKHIGGGYPTVMSAEIYRLLYSDDYDGKFLPTNGVELCKIDSKTLSETGEVMRISDDSMRDGIYEYFTKDNTPEYMVDSEEEIDYRLIKKARYNIIEFDAISGASYEIYAADMGEEYLIKKVKANGNKVRIIDKAYGFGIDYRIIRIE